MRHLNALVQFILVALGLRAPAPVAVRVTRR